MLRSFLRLKVARTMSIVPVKRTRHPQTYKYKDHTDLYGSF